MLRSAIAQDPRVAVEWVRLDLHWRRLPFPAATFDAVVAASVLEYVDEPAVVLGECARVLRSGGVVVCTVPDPVHPIRWLEWLAGAAAYLPLVDAAGHRWPRLENYMTYLRMSRQRRSARWWRAAAQRVGLRPLPCLADTSRRSPLRLLTFWRPDVAEERS